MNLGVFLEPRAHGPFLASLEPRLAVIIRETSAHRDLLRKVKRRLLRPQVPKAKPQNETGRDSDSEMDLPSSPSSSSSSETEAVVPPAAPPSAPSPSKRRRKNRQANQAQRKVDQNAQGAGARVRDAMLGAKPRVHAKSSVSPARRSKCPHCAGYPIEQQCIRTINVESHNCRNLIGAALTCAPAGDRLKPKAPVSKITSYVDIR